MNKGTCCNHFDMSKVMSNHDNLILVLDLDKSASEGFMKVQNRVL